MIGQFKGYRELYKETESVEPGMVVYSYDVLKRPKQDSFQYHKTWREYQAILRPCCKQIHTAVGIC